MQDIAEVEVMRKVKGRGILKVWKKRKVRGEYRREEKSKVWGEWKRVEVPETERTELPRQVQVMVEFQTWKKCKVWRE